MAEDMEEVVERLERRAQDALGFYSFETGREIYVPIADLRALLSALRQRDEALRDMLAMYGSKYDGEMRLKEPAEIEVIEAARAILTGSETNAR